MAPGTLIALDRPPVIATGPAFPKAEHVAFADYKNRFAGQTCFVIGRGPTEFDYRELADLTEPIFFINDAICAERYARSETFFFAHDRQLRGWLNGSVRGTAVLPMEGSILGEEPGVVLKHSGPVVCYHRRMFGDIDLLRKSRDEIADLAELFVHSGTVHSLLHFVWFAGFGRVNFIGCDGLSTEVVTPFSNGAGYDRRLQNRSNSRPSHDYGKIRQVQDLLATALGLETQYFGTPAF